MNISCAAVTITADTTLYKTHNYDIPNADPGAPVTVGTVAPTSTSHATTCPVTLSLTPTHSSITLVGNDIKVDKFSAELDHTFKLKTVNDQGNEVSSTDIKIVVVCVNNAVLTTVAGYDTTVGGATTAVWHTLHDLTALLATTSAHATCPITYQIHEVAHSEATPSFVGSTSP